MQNSRDDGQSFGKGWWSKGSHSQNKKKENSGEQCTCEGSLIKEDAQSLRRNSDSFGKGWWKGKGDTKKTESSQQELKETVTKSEKHNDNNNNVKPDCRCNSRNRRTSNGSSDSHTSVRTESRSSSDDFGVSWWQAQKGTKRKRMSEEMEKNRKSVDGKIRSGKAIEVSENKCRDVVLYKSQATEALRTRFARAAAKISEDLIIEEASHGRAIFGTLTSIPGLWKASLGGSRVSVLLEIVSYFPSSQPAVLVQDLNGHRAPVYLNTTYASEYAVPQLDFVVKVKMSKCLKSGNFMLLRKVMWEELSNKSLAIVVHDMELVEFIFDYLS